MGFLADLGVNLRVCLCGNLQAASAQTLDFIDIDQTGNPPRRGGIEHAQRVKKNPHFRIGNRVLPGNHFRVRTR